MSEKTPTGRIARGPLSGYRLIEIAGIGPTQLTGMLLADMGAEIVRMVRLGPVDLGVPMPDKIQADEQEQALNCDRSEKTAGKGPHP